LSTAGGAQLAEFVRADTQAVKAAVEETVRRQRDAGLDIVNDGEASKPNYAASFAGASQSRGRGRQCLTATLRVRP
jgi:hypothetical protein